MTRLTAHIANRIHNARASCAPAEKPAGAFPFSDRMECEAMASTQHSTAAWQRLRLHILERDLWTCRMCGCLLREGRTAPDSAAVDHIRPAELRPDLFWDEGNLRASCRSCHAVADSIEKRLGPDADAIARAKMAYRPIGADGYPIG